VPVAGDVGVWGPALDIAGLGRIDSDFWGGGDGAGFVSAEVLADTLWFPLPLLPLVVLPFLLLASRLLLSAIRVDARRVSRSMLGGLPSGPAALSRLRINFA
jgi:hypothetical protein